jgi:putative NADH-flavin reductase
VKIALIGITGKVGSHLAREALARGHEVLGLLHPGGAQPDSAAATRSVDVFDVAALTDAVAGQDAIVSAYGAPADAPHRLPAATAAIVGAARAAAVSRIVSVGGAGGLEVRAGVRLADTEGFPPALLPKVQAHADAVAVLAASGLHWTCMAPAAQIVPGECTGRYRLAVGALVSDAAGRSSISYPDFACALLDELEADRHARQVVGTGT